jgi:hypothetical protein
MQNLSDLLLCESVKLGMLLQGKQTGEVWEHSAQSFWA